MKKKKKNEHVWRFMDKTINILSEANWLALPVKIMDIYQ